MTQQTDLIARFEKGSSLQQNEQILLQRKPMNSGHLETLSCISLNADCPTSPIAAIEISTVRSPDGTTSIMPSFHLVLKEEKASLGAVKDALHGTGVNVGDAIQGSRKPAMNEPRSKFLAERGGVKPNALEAKYDIAMRSREFTSELAGKTDTRKLDAKAQKDARKQKVAEQYTVTERAVAEIKNDLQIFHDQGLVGNTALKNGAEFCDYLQRSQPKELSENAVGRLFGQVRGAFGRG